MSAPTRGIDASTADLVVVNAAIWDGFTRDDEAVAVAAGRIVATGSSRSMLELSRDDTEVIDAGGRRLMPGLIDSHLHLVRAGRTWEREVRWDDFGSLVEALEAVATRAEQLGRGQWVAVMGGWHPHQFEEGIGPSRADLDRAAPENPVFVQRAYAETFMNTAAMMQLGWTESDTPDGRLTDPAGMATLRAKMAVSDIERAMSGTRSLLRELNRLGLVGAIDASGFGITQDSYDAFFRLFEEGERGFRARLLVGAARPGSELDDVREWIPAVSLDDDNEFVRHLGAGEVLDYGAHDLEGLSPKDIKARGEHLRSISTFLAEQRWPVHLHSILDSSIGVVLDAWESIGRETLSRLRFSICHADQIGEENLLRVRDLGVGITIQNGMSMRGLDCLPTWGDGIRSSPPVRSMMEMGIPIAAGTDGTVACSYNPWRCIAWLITGQSTDGAPDRVEEQRLDRDEALRLYTSAGAWFSFEEGTRGNLAPGSHADLIILSEDPLRVATERIAQIEATLTMVAGEVVHADL